MFSRTSGVELGVIFVIVFFILSVVGGDIGDLGKLAMIVAAYAISIAFFQLVDRPIDRWRIAHIDAVPSAKVVGRS